MARRLASSSAFLLALLVVSPALADTVTLRNGRSFRDVVASVDDREVTIAIPGGELRLPLAQVASVDSGPAPLREYQARRDALRKGGTATTAADWLALARWARDAGLEGAAREAALAAAALDPGLQGLAPLLAALGMVRDPASGAWVEHDEAMRRRGLVLDAGSWVEPAEQARREEMRERLALERQALVAPRAAAAPESYASDEMATEPGIAAQPVWGGGGYGIGVGGVWPWATGFIPPSRPLKPMASPMAPPPRPQPPPVLRPAQTGRMQLTPARRFPS
ncbi:MAG: hypothetical protein ACM3OB_04295 [Acidobacteriota bacterium]